MTTKAINRSRNTISETAETMTDRRAELSDKLAELRSERTAAILDGKSYPMTGIMEIEAELAGFDEAEGELARRERAARDEAIAKGRAAMRKKIALAEENRLSALQAAEKAARELNDAILEALEHCGEVADGCRALGLPAPAHVHPDGLRDRLSWRLAYVMRDVIDFRRRFGAAVFPEPQDRFSPRWHEAEADIAKSDIERILKGD